ncbi:unnamed protein product [Rhodiola kirilowii]
MVGRVEVTAYDGKSDFNIWKVKIKALLSHHEDETKWSAEQKTKKVEINEEAFNLLILNLTDHVIRKVSTSTTALDVWTRLDILYSNKHAPNLANLKASAFAFKFDNAKSLDDNLDELLKMTILLHGTAHALDATSIVMILMNALPENYQVVKDTFQYSGAVPEYDLLCSALRTRELELKNQKNKSGMNLFVKHKSFNSQPNKPRFPKHDSKAKTDKSKNNKPQTEVRKCFYCGIKEHLRKNCQKLLNKKTKESDTNVATADMHVDVHEVLIISNKSSHDDWILDSGCSYHMCPHRTWFEHLSEHVTNERVFMGIIMHVRLRG